MTSSLLPYAFALLWTVGLGGLGAKVTDIGPWYRALRKPSWQPPDFLFPIVWTSIFVMAAIAFVQAWQAADPMPGLRGWLIASWLLNAVLNVVWSFLFFRMRRPDWAMIEIGGLLPSIVGMMVLTAQVRPASAWWLAPYLAWVSFATILNRAIITRNAPFDR